MAPPTDSTCCLQHLPHSDSFLAAGFQIRFGFLQCVLQVRHMSGEVRLHGPAGTPRSWTRLHDETLLQPHQRKAHLTFPHTNLTTLQGPLPPG